MLSGFESAYQYLRETLSVLEREQQLGGPA